MNIRNVVVALMIGSTYFMSATQDGCLKKRKSVLIQLGAKTSKPDDHIINMDTLHEEFECRRDDARLTCGTFVSRCCKHYWGGCDPRGQQCRRRCADQANRELWCMICCCNPLTVFYGLTSILGGAFFCIRLMAH